MKRFLSIVSIVCLFVGLPGCTGDAPTVPPDPAPDQPASAKDSPWINFSFFQDAVFPCECLGEDIRFYGEVFFRYMEMSNEAGIYRYRFQAVPDTPNSPPFGAIGVDSGTYFDFRNHGPVMETYLDGPSEVHLVRQQELYVDADGRKLLASSRVTVVVNPDGELVVSAIEPFRITCIYAEHR